MEVSFGVHFTTKKTKISQDEHRTIGKKLMMYPGHQKMFTIA